MTTRSNREPSAAISMKGFGHQGFCSLCSIKPPEMQVAFDKQVASGLSATKLNLWMITNVGTSFNRQTHYSHRDHVKNPKDRLVAAVQKRAADHGFAPPKVTEDQFLDAVISSANQRLIENPDEVSIDHGIRAVQVKSASKQKNLDVQNMLIQIFTAPMPQLTGIGLSNAPFVIEGESRELLDAGS